MGGGTGGCIGGRGGCRSAGSTLLQALCNLPAVVPLGLGLSVWVGVQVEGWVVSLQAPRMLPALLLHLRNHRGSRKNI